MGVKVFCMWIFYFTSDEVYKWIPYNFLSEKWIVLCSYCHFWQMRGGVLKFNGFFSLAFFFWSKSVSRKLFTFSTFRFASTQSSFRGPEEVLCLFEVIRNPMTILGFSITTTCEVCRLGRNVPRGFLKPQEVLLLFGVIPNPRWLLLIHRDIFPKTSY